MGAGLGTPSEPMNITHAEHIELRGLLVTIDGHRFVVGEKRTFLDVGFVFLMNGSGDPVADEWLAANTSGFPPGPDWGPLQGPGFVQDPVLVELGIREWEGELEPGPVRIPSRTEAEAALRRRGVPILELVDGRFQPKV